MASWSGVEDGVELDVLLLFWLMEGSCSNITLVRFLRSVYLKSSTGSDCSLFD